MATRKTNRKSVSKASIKPAGKAARKSADKKGRKKVNRTKTAGPVFTSTYTPNQYNEEEQFAPEVESGKSDGSRVVQVLIVLGFIGMAISLGFLWNKVIEQAESMTIPIILTVVAVLLLLFWFFFLR